MTATRLQTKTKDQNSYETSTDITFDSDVSAGSLIVIAVSNDGGDMVSSITDNRGNTYTLIGRSASNYDNWTDFYYAYNCAAGSTTITVNTAGTYSEFCVVAREYGGVLSTSDPLDVSAYKDETSYQTSHTSGATSTPSENDQLVVTILGFDDSTATPSAAGSFGNLSYVVNSDTPYLGVALCDLDMGTAAAQNGQIDTDNYTNGGIGVATFKLAPTSTEVDDERAAVVTGSIDVNSERAAEVTGQDTSESERDAEVHGADTANSERSTEVDGIAKPSLTATQNGSEIDLEWSYTPYS